MPHGALSSACLAFHQPCVGPDTESRTRTRRSAQVLSLPRMPFRHVGRSLGARDWNRTSTTREGHRLLRPGRLPVPPLVRIVGGPGNDPGEACLSSTWVHLLHSPPMVQAPRVELGHDAYQAPPHDRCIRLESSARSESHRARACIRRAPSTGGTGGNGAGPEDRTLLRRFVGPSASPDAHAPRWSERLESNQHGPAPEAGGRPLSHTRIGSPSWSRTTLASFKERNATATLPGRRCRRCESNARAGPYESPLVPNVVGVAGPALAAGDFLVMSQARRLFLHAGGAPARSRTSTMRPSEGRRPFRGRGQCDLHPWKESNLLGWLRRPASGSTDRGMGVE